MPKSQRLPEMLTVALKEARPRVRYLADRTELERLLAALRSPDRAIVAVAVETGMRQGEILSLEWRDVDLAGHRIRVRESKSGEPRTIPMSANCADVLSAHPRSLGSELVFPAPNGKRLTRGALTKRFHNACGRAGIADFRFHDLRHTTASWAVQRHVDIGRLAKVLGHKG